VLVSVGRAEQVLSGNEQHGEDEELFWSIRFASDSLRAGSALPWMKITPATAVLDRQDTGSATGIERRS
jgi:hypothetical protein